MNANCQSLKPQSTNNLRFSMSISNRSNLNREINILPKLEFYPKSSAVCLTPTPYCQNLAMPRNKLIKSGSESQLNGLDKLPPLQPSFSSTNLKIQKNSQIPQVMAAICSDKECGPVKVYAVNTHEGLVRNYNEDRVSIILNLSRPSPKSIENWPKCSFYGIYDGHGGVKCANFLKENLHNYVILDTNFPENPREAIINGFKAAERDFVDLALQINDRSGSCATICLFVNSRCFVANVGDSRSILSTEKGNKIFSLTADHKPGDEPEKTRILNAGGKVYTSMPLVKGLDTIYRILPGRLSVSRSFGDIDAKVQSLGGNPQCLIAEPDIKAFKIQKDHDFILMGCDGIFDRLNNREVVDCI